MNQALLSDGPTGALLAAMGVDPADVAHIEWERLYLTYPNDDQFGGERPHHDRGIDVVVRLRSGHTVSRFFKRDEIPTWTAPKVTQRDAEEAARRLRTYDGTDPFLLALRRYCFGS